MSKPAAVLDLPEFRRCDLAFIARFREAAEGGKEPNDATREIPVIIIKEGMGNLVDRHLYEADLLARSAGMFNGIKANADHLTKSQERDQPEGSVKEIVGYYKDAHVETIGGKICLAATLKIMEGAAYDWAWTLVKEAWAYAKQFPGKDLVGISINAFGKSHAVEGADGKIVNVVDEFSEIQSADIVTAAGAGGGFRMREGARLLEVVSKALEGQSNGGKQIMKTKKTAAELLKEGEAATSALHGLLKGHHEALKAIHGKIMADPAYAKEYGPAMEKLMKAHEEVLKHAEGVHMNLGQETTPEGEGAASGAAPSDSQDSDGVEESFKKMEAQYKSGKLSEGERKVFELLLRSRTEQAIRENVAMVAATIKESGIPEAFLGDLPIMCAGKSASDVKKIVEARKALVQPLIGNRGQGAGSGNHGGSAKTSQLQEKIAASGIKMRETVKA